MKRWNALHPIAAGIFCRRDGNYWLAHRVGRIMIPAAPAPPAAARVALDEEDLIMSLKTFFGAAIAAALLLPGVCQAGADDYVFEPVEDEVKQGEGATLAVRLLDKATKKPVADAVIIQTRIDMAPDDMASMDASIELMPSMVPGIYRFKTKLVMAGRRRLSLAAKVQGEPETVRGEILFTAKR